MTPETEFAAPVFETSLPSALPSANPAANQPENTGLTVGEVILQFLTHPFESLVLKWNWKSAVFSSLIRANIFFFVTLRSGWQAALGAFSAELLYRVLTSGFYGAMTQALSNAEPAWAAAIAAMVLLPLSSHSMEFVVHSLRHTPHLKANILTSIGFTVISTLFNFYAMRKGSLITGCKGQSVSRDIQSMPRLIACFVAAGPIAIWKFARHCLLPASVLSRRLWRTGIARPLHESQNAASD